MVLPKKPKNLGVRLQATVCRDPEDDAVVTSIVCLIGERVAYDVKADVYAQSLEDTLSDWGINGDRESRVIQDEVKSTSEKIMKVVQSLECSIAAKDWTRSQANFIEIDFVLSRRDGRLVVIPVELRAQHTNIGQRNLPPWRVDKSGDLWQPMIATMLQLSLRFLVQDKVIIVLGAGYKSKSFIWTEAKEYGVKIYLVDDDVDHFASSMVAKFIHFDMSDHTLDREHCRFLSNLLENDECPGFDGCVTFWEDCVPLAAMICEALSLTGGEVEAAIIAKTKSKTQQVLSSISPDLPFGNLMNKLSSKTYRIETEDDIAPAIRYIHMPAVMKPEYSAGAIAAKLLLDAQECYDFFSQYQRELQKDVFITGACHGNSMLLMDYIDGPEHGIDIVIFDQTLVAGFVHDKGPTRLPCFTKAASCFPTRLSPSKENELIFAAYLCCIGVGLKNGTFNVDMKMTTSGPKLIEINARMGGYALRDSIKHCYKADLLLCSFAIACGIKPSVIKMKPTSCIINMNLIPSQHGHVLHEENVKRLIAMKEQGLVKFTLFEETQDKPLFQEPCCAIGIIDKDCHTATLRIESLCKFLGLGLDGVPLSYYFNYFK